MNDLIVCYLGGIVLGCLFLLTNKGDIAKTERPWIGYLITTIGWPLLLPFSFYALAGNILWIFGICLPGMQYPTEGQQYER